MHFTVVCKYHGSGRNHTVPFLSLYQYTSASVKPQCFIYKALTEGTGVRFVE